MNEHKLHDDVARAQRAERILTEPLFIECVDKVRKAYLAAWEATKPEDAAKREQYWLSLKALEQVLNELAQVANSGKMSRVMLERAYQKSQAS